MNNTSEPRSVIGNYVKGVYCLQCFQYWNIDKLMEVFRDGMVTDAIRYNESYDVCLDLSTADSVKYSKPFIFQIMSMFDRSYGIKNKVVITVADKDGAKKLDKMLTEISEHTDSHITYRVVASIEETYEALGLNYATDNN